ncbi:MAG: glycosyltransferase family 2 protein [Alphaproteobacteria bacterium]|nr:glycosyltransferase family 2 protein [Alphaproteobacteria bacterium]
MAERLVFIVIPILNEERSLPELGRRLPQVLEPLGVDWRVLFVDDGSIDGSLDEIKRLNGRDPRFGAISFSRNFGKEIAVAAGLRHASGDACIIMDADLQHPPEVLSSFIARWREGYDIVYGQRINRETDGPIYRFLARVFYRFFNFLVDSDIPNNAGDFRLLSRRAIDAMNRLNERARFNKGLYSWIGFRSIAVPYDVGDRFHGSSRWRLRRLVHYAIDGVTSFSTIPLRIWSLLGLAISLLAMVYSVSFMISTLIFGADIPGFPTLVVSVMFFAGAQLISLGIMGEYLGRVYDEVKARPLYIIAERIGIGEPPAGPAPSSEPASVR